MTYGLTDEGFVRKDLATIRGEIETALCDSFGEANVKPHLEDSRSVWNKLVGALVLPLSDLWELTEAVYNAFYPSTSFGISLARCAEFVGISPKPATSSTAQIVLEGVAATTIPDESKIATANTGDQFQTDGAVTLSAAVSVCANTALIGVITLGRDYTITINGNNYTHTAVAGNDEDAVGAALKALIDAGGEPVTVDDLTGGELRILGDPDPDGLPTPFAAAVNAHVRLASVGNLASCKSVEAGPVIGYAESITEIVNPLSGWVAAWNPLDAILGQVAETDSALRIRRDASLSIPGAGTVEAIRSKLLDIAAVTACIVLENTSDAVDGNGLQPHSIEAVVENGEDEDIAEVLWANKGGGIYLNGAETVTVTDSQGFDHVVRFNRPTAILMWVRVSYTKYSEEDFPANGETTIAATVLSTGNALSLDNDVLPQRFHGPIFTAVAGIRTLLVEVAEDDGMGAPGAYQSTPWAIGFREVARFDSARMVVQEV